MALGDIRIKTGAAYTAAGILFADLGNIEVGVNANILISDMFTIDAISFSAELATELGVNGGTGAANIWVEDFTKDASNPVQITTAGNLKVLGYGLTVGAGLSIDANGGLVVSSNLQELDGLTFGANKVLYTDGSGNLQIADAGVNSGIQAYDLLLTNLGISGISTDQMIYGTGTDTVATAATTSFGRGILNWADALAGRTSLDVYATSTIDNLLNGLSWKAAVVVASVADIDLSVASTPNPIDGITVLDGERVLLKDQTAGEENGIWVAVTAADPTTWTRSEDADSESELLAGAVFVTDGTANGDKAFVQTTDAPIVVGVTVLTYSQFSNAATIYTASDGIILNGSNFEFDYTGLGGSAIAASDLIAFYNGAYNKTDFQSFEHSLDLNNLLGTLSVANGGTGNTSLLANGILFGNGTGVIQSQVGTLAGHILSWNPTAGDWSILRITGVTNEIDVTFGSNGEQSLGISTSYDGGTGIVTLGTITTGTWKGNVIDQTYLVGQSGTNTGDQTTLYDGSGSLSGPTVITTGANDLTFTATTGDILFNNNVAPNPTLIIDGTTNTIGMGGNANLSDQLSIYNITGSGNTTALGIQGNNTTGTQVGAEINVTATATNNVGLRIRTANATSTNYAILVTDGNTGFLSTNPTETVEIGELGNVATLKFVDGNQALGNVLTSDANGVATWQAVSNKRTWTWGAARNSANTTLSYLRTFDGTPTNVATYVVPYNCNITDITCSTSVIETWTAEVHINGVIAGSISVTAAASDTSTGLSIAVSTGDVISFYCNGTNISHPHIDAWFLEV
jgi:hypothetical protein